MIILTTYYTQYEKGNKYITHHAREGNIFFKNGIFLMLLCFKGLIKTIKCKINLYNTEIKFTNDCRWII